MSDLISLFVFWSLLQAAALYWHGERHKSLDVFVRPAVEPWPSPHPPNPPPPHPASADGIIGYCRVLSSINQQRGGKVNAAWACQTESPVVSSALIYLSLLLKSDVKFKTKTSNPSRQSDYSQKTPLFHFREDFSEAELSQPALRRKASREVSEDLWKILIQPAAFWTCRPLHHRNALASGARSLDFLMHKIQKH